MKICAKTLFVKLDTAFNDTPMDILSLSMARRQNLSYIHTKEPPLHLFPLSLVVLVASYFSTATAILRMVCTGEITAPML